MTANPRISLEHWRSLLAVVDAGGYAQAAAVLHKSQSAVTYAVQKMEALLGVKVFEVVGRKAHLTSTGEVLYRRAKALLDEAGALEGAAFSHIMTTPTPFFCTIGGEACPTSSPSTILRMAGVTWSTRSRPSLDSCADPFSLPIFSSSSQFLAVVLAFCASTIAARRIGSVARSEVQVQFAHSIFGTQQVHLVIPPEVA